MIKRTQNAVELIIHTDTNGVLWFESSEQPGSVIASDISCVDFLAQEWFSRVWKIKLLGFRQNAALICTIYESITQTSPLTLLVGTPAIAQTIEKANATSIVLSARELDLPSSCGGWHEVSTFDYANYKLIAAVDSGASDYEIEKLLEQHPAYPAVSFVSSDHVAIAKMIADIVDPRWFVDPVKPDRTSRLRSFMGMHIDIMEDILRGKIVGNRAERANRIFNAWDSDKNDGKSHSDFLYKMLDDINLTLPKTTLKACVRFLLFVKGVWLDQMAAKGRILFVPEYFFDNEVDIEKYHEHLKKLNRQRNR